MNNKQQSFDKRRENTPPKPKSIKEVPSYVYKLLRDFFVRLFYIFKLVWDTGKWILFLMMFIAICEGFIPVLISIKSKDILNALQDEIITIASPEQSFGAFLTLSIMVLLVTLFVFRIVNNVISRINNAVTRMAGERVVAHIKEIIMLKTKELDISSFDKPEFYEKLENANREAGTRPIQILSSSFSIVSNIIGLVSYVIILSSSLPLAAICVVAVSIPGAIINFHYRHKNFQYMWRNSKQRRQMNYYSDLVVNKDLAKEVRIFDLNHIFVERYKAAFNTYYSGLKKLILKENVLHVVVTIISSITSCIFYVLLAYQVFLSKIKIGDYSLHTGALSNISSHVASLIATSAHIFEGTLFIDNLMLFMREKPTVVPSIEKPLKIKPGPHTFDFINVCFKYPGVDRYIIKNVNLHFRPGETVVLVGLNGAGKTTLIKLLTRLYDPTEGQILLDGEDIKKYDINDLYKMYGIIFQDFGKYAFSISENIQFGDINKEFNEERMKDAAESANATDFISRLPNQYDTPLMRYFELDGKELSIGQWQKLAIARAFYSDSDVLILDEPTASLDAIAEQEIYNQFNRLRESKTTVFVSHRLSSATIASKIVVLEYGEVIEEGTHEELMRKRGRYYELFSTQAQKYITSMEELKNEN
ncbi:MAG: ABC transporter ATP-binding protein/permease [Clostridia bacterium]|nr:ABC transporter ATP-binding protein/permease [Clostridia bacterium]